MRLCFEMKGRIFAPMEMRLRKSSLSLTLFSRQIADLLLVSFCLALFSAGPVTLDSPQNKPGRHLFTHQLYHLIDVAGQIGKHSLETPGHELTVILIHNPGIEIAGNADRLLLPVPNHLLPYYLVYTQTTTSRL